MRAFWLCLAIVFAPRVSIAEMAKCINDKDEIAFSNIQCPDGYRVYGVERETEKRPATDVAPGPVAVPEPAPVPPPQGGVSNSDRLLREEFERLKRQVSNLQQKTIAIENAPKPDIPKPYRPPVVSSYRGGRWNGGPVGGEKAQVIVDNPNDYAVTISVACRGTSQNTGQYLSGRANYTASPGRSSHDVPMNIFFFQALECW
jgi:hypothetical protein